MGIYVIEITQRVHHKMNKKLKTLVAFEVKNKFLLNTKSDIF